MSDMFADRAQAGRRLAARLEGRFDATPVVLALPRGGLPVAAEVARTLGAPLDLMLVRKLGAPGQPELAMGALADGDPPVRVINEDVRRHLGVTEAQIEEVEAREAETLTARRRAYLEDRARVPLEGRHVIVVDDGIATGATARAAIRAARAAGAASVTVATPVAPPDTVAALREEADEVIAVRTPESFMGISQFYLDFHQLDDEEVKATLRAFPAGP